jgi:hypothetical protein
MKMPETYIKEILGYNSSKDLIENLYLQSLINAFPIIAEINGICDLDEPKIRNEFQKVINFYSGKLSRLINNNLIFFAVENQRINLENEINKTDIEFNIPGLKFVIECKKLNGINKSQYIDKGISRFINHKYIGTNEKYAGMCSFVVEGNITNIIKGTQQRIQEYHWLSSNSENICSFENSFTSNHYKIDNENILIYHLFFEINLNQNS